MIDEFADLISPDNNVEALITRLAQMGRPAGIHLIISTQRPAVKIITGTIKSNFMTRLAFRVATGVDSRTIIDQNGAEKLKGEGDMLYYSGNNVVRLQGALTGTAEVTNVVDFIGKQRGYPSAMYLPEYMDESLRVSGFDPEDMDPFFDEAAMMIVLHQQASTSLIQRKLKLGYNRAGRIIDQLEAAKIVGPFEGSKAREVLFADEYALARHLENLHPGKTTAKPTEPANAAEAQRSAAQTAKIQPICTPEQTEAQPKKRTWLDKLFNR